MTAIQILKRLACAVPVALLWISVTQAQILDGSYDGTLQCGSLLTDPSKKPWTQPLKLHFEFELAKHLKTEIIPHHGHYGYHKQAGEMGRVCADNAQTSPHHARR